MGQALYRKYRSKSLAEIIGQEHITTTLANALKAGRVSHAYLLTGPRGVGKTSIARILAHEINGLPYTDESHLDIIEIDAASNRRIDEIRDLRDRVSTAPSSAKYKVYIIDEVHMLTREAFNALLKTLEEPPAHVVFILATTESHKLPETIVSRTQRYTFRPVPAKQVIAHLRSIAESEKIAIDDDALALIAAHGEGSFRDSISLLDQASSTSEQVTRTDVERILGLAPLEQIASLRGALSARSSGEVVTRLNGLYGSGYEPAAIAAQLSAVLRSEVLAGSATASNLSLLKQLLDVPGARQPRQLLELQLLEACVLPEAGSAAPATTPVQPQPASTPPAPRPIAPLAQPPQPVATAPQASPVQSTSKPASQQPAATKPTPRPVDSALSTAAVAPTAAASNFDSPTGDVLDLWQQTLDSIKSQYNTLYGIARMAKPQMQGNTLTLGFKHGFSQKRINEAKNRQIFAEAVERLYGSPVEIICVVIDADQPAAPDVATVSNIFGGAELLES